MKTAVALGLVLVLCLCSGCASLVAGAMNGKLPITSARNLKVEASIAAVGGGTLEVSNLATDPVTGVVTAGTYHETITTGGGQLIIHGEEVTIKKK